MIYSRLRLEVLHHRPELVYKLCEVKRIEDDQAP
jgi:hypothetical protein